MINKNNICTELHTKTTLKANPVSPAIIQSSTFYFEDYNQYINVNMGQEELCTYTRGSNPTHHQLEEKLAELEQGEKAILFSSGMGAISSTILSLIQSNDHIIIVNTVYGSSVKLIQQLEKWNISSTHILTLDIQDIENAILDNTRMIYFESPSSQKFELLDLEAIASIAKKNNIITAIDNTWSTPIFQNPLTHGIDIVIHSLSKYIGGHSDLVGGVVISHQDYINKIHNFGSILLGATLSPHDAWLALRGLRTLPVRMKQHNETITYVTHALSNDDRVKYIYQPSNQKELSNKYLKGQSSLFGLVLNNATPSIIERFINHLELFTIAYSWGGYESLIIPVFKGNNEEELKVRGLDLGHMRIYLGLEDKESLLKDLTDALDYAYEE